MNTLIGLSHTVSTCYYTLDNNIMRLSMSRPTTTNTGEVGIFACGCYNAPGMGSDWHANPLHIPHLAPTGDQSHYSITMHNYMSAFVCFTEKYERVKCSTPWTANSLQIPIYSHPTLVSRARPNPREGSGKTLLNELCPLP